MAVGFTLIFAAAICGGAFALPLKFVRRFKWENTWFWGSFFAMTLIPWTAAFFLVPHLASSVLGTRGRPLLMALLFGAGWGFGTVTFGIGISMIGLSLGYAVIMGVNTAMGSLLPMLLLSRADTGTQAGHVILLGIGSCIAGVFVCGYAGISKDRASAAESPGKDHKSSVVKGMAICVLSGVLSSFLNLGFAFAQDIAVKAQGNGTSPSVAGLAIWLVVFGGSFPAVVISCGGLQAKRQTYRNNIGPGAAHDYLLTLVMGLLWFGAIFLYGMGAFRLGRIGTSVGWAINISASLIVANLFGFATGEWRAAPWNSTRWILAGLAILIAAMGILGYGNSMLAGS